MDDHRQFFRYLVPGACFLTEVALYFLLYGFVRPEAIPKLPQDTWSAGAAVIALVAAAGVGYLLSLVHHGFYSSAYFLERLRITRNCPMFKVFLTSNREVLAEAVSRGLLRIRYGQHCLTQEAIRRIPFLKLIRISSSVWNSMLESNPAIRGAHPHCANFVHIMHGAGTAFIGAVLAGLSWLLLHGPLSGVNPRTDSLIVLVPWVGFIFLHLASFIYAVDHSYRLSGLVLLNALEKTPVVFSIQDFELK